MPLYRKVMFFAKRARPLLFLGGFAFIFLGDSLLAGKAPCMRDTFCDFLPWRTFARQAVRDGAIPLWNHYSSCGQPFIAEPQSAFFYPLNWLFFFLPITFAFKLWLATHLFIAAVGMYCLMRHWRLHTAPAMLSATAYAFGTYTIAQIEYQSILSTIVWSPFVLLCVSRVTDAASVREFTSRRQRARLLTSWIILLALIWAIQYLAGYPQPFLFTLIMVAVYPIARCLTWRNRRALIISLISMALAGVVAFCLAMPQFLLTWELIPLSVRGGEFDPSLQGASFHPRLYLGWLFPFIAGHPGRFGAWWGQAWTMFEFWLGTCYVGIPPLVLASLGVVASVRLRGSHQRRHGFVAAYLVVCGAAALLVAMGKYTPIYMILYEVFPLFDRFRWPSKTLLVVAISLSALSGLGLQAIMLRFTQSTLKRDRRILMACMAWSGLFLLMLAALPRAMRSPHFFSWLTGGAFVHDSARPDRYLGLLDDYETALVFLAVALLLIVPMTAKRISRPRIHLLSALLVILTFVNLFIVSRQVHYVCDDDVYEYEPHALMKYAATEEPYRIVSEYLRWDLGQLYLYGVRDADIFRFAKDAAVGETSLPYGVFKVTGGGSLEVGLYKEFSEILFDPHLSDWAWHRVADLLNIRYMISGPPMDQIIQGKTPPKIDVLENPDCLPRALVVESWQVIPDLQSTGVQLMNPTHDPARVAVLDGEPEHRTVMTMTGQGAEAPRVDAMRYDWNRVEIEAQARRPSVLVLNDTWYPGWKASVDGQPTTILRANAVFRAIALAPGKHHVLFEYDPWQFRVGATVSIGTLFVLSASLFIVWRRR